MVFVMRSTSMTPEGDAPTGPDLTKRRLGHDPELALELSDLRVSFATAGKEPVRVVNGLTMSVHRGEAVAIVGESGSGKSVSMRAVLGLLPPSATVDGSVTLHSAGAAVDLLRLPERRLRAIRGARIGMVFQNAMEAMNPTVPLLRQLCEPLLWHKLCDRREAKRRAVAALGDVGIPNPERCARMYPFQLSGGMRQRAMIAMAMISRPDVLIADEPTTAVDVTVQRQILDLLAETTRTGTAVVMITHDLGVARYFCGETNVLYAGELMESGQTKDLLSAPRHPYTQGLLESALDINDSSPLKPIPGQPPDLAARPEGCSFRPRCHAAHPVECSKPQTLLIQADRLVRCWRAGDV
jgi:oligopeptide/dipeptide ABC transporter ATP-binding protein